MEHRRSEDKEGRKQNMLAHLQRGSTRENCRQPSRNGGRWGSPRRESVPRPGKDRTRVGPPTRRPAAATYTQRVLPPSGLADGPNVWRCCCWSPCSEVREGAACEGSPPAQSRRQPAERSALSCRKYGGAQHVVVYIGRGAPFSNDVSRPCPLPLAPSEA